MKKHILILALTLSASLSANAFQTKEQIINYCTRVYEEKFGNEMVLWCINNEIDARNKIIAIAKSK